jgi:hypothetical protein
LREIFITPENIYGPAGTRIKFRAGKKKFFETCFRVIFLRGSGVNSKLEAVVAPFAAVVQHFF